MTGLLVLIALVIGLSPASAQRCAPRDAALAILEKEYGERPLLRGEMDAGFALEVIVSPGGATWTIFITRPDNLSCFLATGSNLLPAVNQKPATPERSP